MPGTSTVWFETARARYSTALEGVQVVESREHELQMFLEPNAQYQEVLGIDRSFSKQELDELKQRVRIAKALLTSV